MPTESHQPILALITVAAIAFAVGYFVSPNPSEAEKREAELAQRSTEKLTGKRSASSSRKGPVTIGRAGDPSSPVALSEHHESREFFAKINVTKEDLERVEQMEKRRAQGEYILQNERPTTRKFLDYDFGEIVAQATADNAGEYDQLFAQTGVAPESAEQLKAHLAKIHRASLEATVAIQQILQARQDYDERLRSTMNEENYQRYRQVEEAKPAHREYEEFQRFVEQQNTALDPQHEQALVGLVQTTQAYTSKSWHGPFDGLPQPVLGTPKTSLSRGKNRLRRSRTGPISFWSYRRKQGCPMNTGNSWKGTTPRRSSSGRDSSMT
ncbi:MAG: hypothetical protein L0Z50_23720 [Verrucomicrobiales bacterium]|nr:hypothetical protein [Verrucomicrobiales bacterium]